MADSPHGTLLVVADGMGGHAGGEVASQTATEAILGCVQQAEPGRGGEAILAEALQRANQSIRARAEQEPTLRGMGTTAVCVLVHADEIAWAHVGDSRLYVHRPGELRQVTRDQSRVQAMVDAGQITADEARVHPMRNVISQALGSRADVTPEMGSHPVQPGMVLLLCTDGLNGMVEDRRIGEILDQGNADALDPTAQALVDAALEAGGEDNVTVVLANPAP